MTLPILTPGQWTEVSGTTLRPVVGGPPAGVDPATWWNPVNIMADYSGGVLDTLRNRLLLPACGGHAGWPGNSVYALPLDGSGWQRLTEPSTYTQGTLDPLADGRPDSRHTYDNLCYLPEQDAVFLFGGSLWREGWGSRNAWRFNCADNSWARLADFPYGDVRVAQCEWDPVLRRVVVMAQSKGYATTYDPGTNTWQYRASGLGGTDSERTGVLVPADRKMYVCGWTRSGTADDARTVREVSLSAWTVTKRLTTGATAMCAALGPGFAHDPIVDRFVAWKGGSALYWLDRATWTWTLEQPPGPTPPAAPSAGQHKRFGYSVALDALYAVTSIDANLWLYLIPRGAVSYRAPQFFTVGVA